MFASNFSWISDLQSAFAIDLLRHVYRVLRINWRRKKHRMLLIFLDYTILLLFSHAGGPSIGLIYGPLTTCTFTRIIFFARTYEMTPYDLFFFDFFRSPFAIWCLHFVPHYSERGTFDHVSDKVICKFFFSLFVFFSACNLMSVVGWLRCISVNSGGDLRRWRNVPYN